MKKIWTIIIIALITSCIKDISIDLNNPKSKIVVNSFFSPQGSLLVNISKSIGVLAADTLSYIDNAEVELFNDNTMIGKLTHNQKGFYSLTIAMIPNEIYSISVSVPDMETVSSEDSIPIQIPILSLDTITYNNKYLYCEITFQDILDMSNFYLLDVTSKYPVLNNDSILSKQIEIVVSDNIIENSSIGATSKRVFFSDEKIQDTEYELSFLLLKEPLLESLNEGSNTLYINFKTISSEYYKYIKTYSQAQTQQIDVYSNINNGYGIFVGYNLSQDSIVIRK